MDVDCDVVVVVYRVVREGVAVWLGGCQFGFTETYNVWWVGEKVYVGG